MSGKWEKNILRVTPYTPGEQPKTRKKIIKLNTNECPYPPSEKVQRVLDAFDTDTLALYPDPEAGKLAAACAKAYGVEQDNVFTGVGSDEVLALAFQTFFSVSGKPVLFPDITYSFYKVWASLYGIPYEELPLDDEFRLHAEEYFDAPGGVVIANPNAPTGIVMPREEIEAIVKKNPDTVVIVDEAYIDFAGNVPGVANPFTALPLIRRYDNLLVVQTCSKSRALAGLRVGYAFGSKKLIGCLKDVKFSFNSYTMNRFAIEAGAAAILDTMYLKRTCAKIKKTRARMNTALEGLGFRVLPSDANFVFAAHQEVPGEEVFEKLRERGIFVRHFHALRTEAFNRFTVGTDDQADALIANLAEIVQ